MKVFFGTVVRSAPVRRGGELVRLDWKSKTVQARVPVFPTNPGLENDPNPRGNSRGCRGVEILGDQIIASSYHTIKIYDMELRHRRDISHGLMVGLHETYSAGDGRIWVSSTAIDAALEYDLMGGNLVSDFWPRDSPKFQKCLGLTPLDIDKRADQRSLFLGEEHTKHKAHLHLNAVARWRNQTLALFNTFGVIANLNSGEIVLQDPCLKGAHNLLIIDNDIAVLNDTYGRTVRFYNLRSGELVKVIDILRFKWVQSLEKIAKTQNFVKDILKKLGVMHSAAAKPLFVRGLDLVGDFLFVGLSPASILCIDWRKDELVDTYRYSVNVQVCVHGLRVLLE